MSTGGLFATMNRYTQVAVCILFHVDCSNRPLSHNSFDINTTVTECDGDKESLLFDSMDPVLLSGPVSLLQDEL